MKSVVQEFIKDVAIPTHYIFLGNRSDGSKWFTAKWGMVMDTDGIYCYLGDRDPDGRDRTCNLIGLVNYKNGVIRFFDNETLRGMFSSDELEELKKQCGGEFLSFEQINKDFLHSFEVESSDENKLYPLPDDVGSPYYEDYHDYNMFEYLLNTQKFLSREGLNSSMDDILVIDSNGYDSGVFFSTDWGWYGDISRRWLASATYPEYPNFDMKHEWDSFVAILDEMAEEDLANPDSDIKKCVDMQKAAQGKDIVEIAFRLTDGNELVAPIDAHAFENGNAILTGYGPIINLDECYLCDLNDFENYSDVLKDRNKCYGKAKYWIEQKQITCISDYYTEKEIWPLP